MTACFGYVGHAKAADEVYLLWEMNVAELRGPGVVTAPAAPAAGLKHTEIQLQMMELSPRLAEIKTIYVWNEFLNVWN